MRAARLLPFRRPGEEQPASPLAAVPKTNRWGALSTPVHVADTEAIARAKSILACYGHFDITASHARDVIRWHANKETR